MVEEEDAFLVVLIGSYRPTTFTVLFSLKSYSCFADEVESLTAARAGAMAGTEPSDGLRVCGTLATSQS
jgi:hypothetical protein